MTQDSKSVCPHCHRMASHWLTPDEFFDAVRPHFEGLPGYGGVESTEVNEHAYIIKFLIDGQPLAVTIVAPFDDDPGYRARQSLRTLAMRGKR